MHFATGWVGLVLLGAVSACTPAPERVGDTQVITGSATYHERIALPPQAMFEASVEDVSRADAPSARIGSVRIESPQLPIRFSIAVDAKQVQPNRRYVVRARVTIDGRLLYTSDTAHPVFDAAGTRHVEILLRRVSAPPAAGAPPSQRMSGHYNYLADAAVYVDCASGQRMAVAEEGDNAALQRAYMAARPSPGAAMLVTVDAHVQMRPPVEGGGAARPVLVVERYVAIGAGPCGTPHGTAALENTYWKLVRVRERLVVATERQREAHLILQAPQRRVVGSSGCNRLIGSYVLDGERLSFSRAAGTLMACPQGMDDERALLEALAATTRWRIDAEQLDLIDAQGATLARFEAVYLR